MTSKQLAQIGGAAVLVGVVVFGVGLFEVWHPLAWLYAGAALVLVGRETVRDAKPKPEAQQ
jgi:4-hydroxybenzoate polyprenyltransferase